MRMIFNEEKLSDWKSLDPVGGDKIIRELIELFLSTHSEKYAQLKKAFAERNCSQLQKLAHSFKSDFGNLGAEKAFDLLNQLEVCANKAELSKIESLFDSIEVIHDETINQIVQYGKKI